MLDSYQKNLIHGDCVMFLWNFKLRFLKNTVEYYIPLFTRENANKYCDGEKGSACGGIQVFQFFESDKFKCWERNTEPRIKFLNWCISELKSKTMFKVYMCYINESKQLLESFDDNLKAIKFTFDLKANGLGLIN